MPVMESSYMFLNIGFSFTSLFSVVVQAHHLIVKFSSS